MRLLKNVPFFIRHDEPQLNTKVNLTGQAGLTRFWFMYSIGFLVELPS